jgi:hypothetical protein
MRKQGNMLLEATPPKVNISSITESKDSEMHEMPNNSKV